MLLLFFDPFNSFSHLPNTKFFLTFLHVNAFAMLFTLEPFAVVATTIGPGKDTVAMLLIIFVIADVFTAVTPSEHTLAFHSVVNPVTVKDATVGPDILAAPVNIVIVKGAFIRALVSPHKFTFAVLFAFLVFAGVL